MQNRNTVTRIISFTWLSRSTIVEIIALLFIILFLYTGISKLMEYAVFKEQIAESPLLKPIAPFIAWSLPLTEFLVSALLIIPRWRLKGLYASLALMIAFTVYIGAIMTFNKELPCSCGGVISLLSWQGHLIFNSLFILLAFTGVLLERQIRRSMNKI
ncbi:MauE/DoxX family redox-associated membrane protein [Niastella caeni]